MSVIDVLRATKPKLFIATPTYNGLCYTQYTKSCLDLAQLLSMAGVEYQFQFTSGDGTVTRARNLLADLFLQSKYTHILWVDSDVSFNAQDVIKLLLCDVDIVGGPYPRKAIDWAKVYDAVSSGKVKREDAERLGYYGVEYFVLNRFDDGEKINLKDMVKVKELGGGFMLVKRGVYEDYKKQYPDWKFLLRYKPEDTREIAAFYHNEIDPESKMYLGDDYFFCKQSRNMGKSIWLLPSVELSHDGSYTYKGIMEALT